MSNVKKIEHVVNSSDSVKVLLVYPEFPITFWSFKYALKFINKKVSLPPLGLLTVSSLLPASWEKKLVDLNADKLRDNDIMWADYVFVSAMIAQKESAKDIIARAKSLGKVVVAGGPLFSTGYSDFSNVDCFVLNEGEVTIPLFLDDLSKGTLQRIYTSNDKPDITKTPVPDWTLLKKSHYASMAIQISRGCPWNCEFCDIIIMNGRIPRIKEPSQVIAEFDALYNAGWRGSLFIVDDNFIGNKVKVKRILIAIGEWMEKMKRPFTLYTEASVNLADEEEIMMLMRRANFNTVFVGIETPDEDALKSCGKMQNTNKDLIEKVKILQRNGLEVQAGFIVGFDTDSSKTFDNLIRFIQQSGIVTAMVGLLQALPGTALYKRLHEAGRIVETPSSGNNTDKSMNFIPIMNKSVLINGYKRILESVYNPRNYNKRIKTFLAEYRRSGKRPRISLTRQLWALYCVIWKIGIIGQGKWHFWKLCIWTLFRRPNLLPEAITLSIFGFHYRMVLIDSLKTE
ncbi:MAG TPA: B12-binding domain-containing radical SAM protein [Chitinispirillaceae bacterium]|nr:B12-binding domain-containing radical SAM protein [Chitinispirillaceae bacterium]